MYLCRKVRAQVEHSHCLLLEAYLLFKLKFSTLYFPLIQNLNLQKLIHFILRLRPNRQIASSRLLCCLHSAVHCNITKKKRLQFLFYGMRCFPDSTFTIDLHCCSLDASTDYGRPERKQPSMHGRKFNPSPKFLGMAAAYFVCHIGPIFQIFDLCLHWVSVVRAPQDKSFYF